MSDRFSEVVGMAFEGAGKAARNLVIVFLALLVVAVGGGVLLGWWLWA